MHKHSLCCVELFLLKKYMDMEYKHIYNNIFFCLNKWQQIIICLVLFFFKGGKWDVNWEELWKWYFVVVFVITFTKGTLSSPLPSLKSTKDCTWYIRKDSFFSFRLFMYVYAKRDVARIFSHMIYAFVYVCVFIYIRNIQIYDCGWCCCCCCTGREGEFHVCCGNLFVCMYVVDVIFFSCVECIDPHENAKNKKKKIWIWFWYIYTDTHTKKEGDRDTESRS